MSTAQEQAVEPTLNGEPDADALSAGAELAQMLTSDPVALLDMFIDVMRLARDAAQTPKGKFHTVIVPDTTMEATVTTVGSFDEFLVVWQEAWQQRAAQIFGFSPRGELILPSKGGDHMVAPWGRFPLYTKGNDADADPLGRLGPLPSIPKAVPKPAPAVPEADDYEEPVDQENDDIEDDVDQDDVDADEDD